MGRGIFITGTDTGVGKTLVTGLLGDYLLRQGYSVITQKWVQSGCRGFPEDIAAHRDIMGQGRDAAGSFLDAVCPYIFKLPASAHLAAEAENHAIDPEHVKQCFTRLSQAFDVVLVEGMGGALVPYTRKALLIDIAQALDLPVLIVAKNQLGTINHTLLTIEAIRSRGLSILGIVFNGPEGQGDVITEDNPRIIKELTGQPIWGSLSWTKDIEVLKADFKAMALNGMNKGLEKAYNWFHD